MTQKITGTAFVVDDNIDTDQIIPAECLNLVPTIPDEYRKLGSYALSGLPETMPRFVANGEDKTEFRIIVAGKNFGCGSSREHAPVSLGAAGAEAVIAESFARIFFRNCIATGEIYPIESEERLCDLLSTGDQITIDIENGTISVPAKDKIIKMKDLGSAGEVIQKGGLFEFARQTGMMDR